MVLFIFTCIWLLSFLFLRSNLIILKEYKCKDCGETNPENFNKGSKTRCRICTNIHNKNTYYKKEKKDKSPYVKKPYNPLIHNKYIKKERTQYKYNPKYINKFPVKYEYFIKYDYKLPEEENAQSNILLSNNEFITNVELAYPNKYSFELTNYINCRTDVTVTCIKHNHHITTTANNLLRSKFKYESVGSCPLCMDEHKSTIRKNIFNLLKISHDGVYNYKFETYIGSGKPMIAICDRHGEFNITPQTHIKGRCKCFKCFPTGSYRINNQRYLWCDLHGDVKISKNRKFSKGCPECNPIIKLDSNSRLLRALNKKTNNTYEITYVGDKINICCNKHNTNNIYDKNNVYNQKFYCKDCYDEKILNQNQDKINKIKEVITDHYSEIYEYIEYISVGELKVFNKITNKENIIDSYFLLKKTLTNDKEAILRISTPFISYAEAKKLVNANNITSYVEYKFWRKSTKQYQLPANPNRIYKEFTTTYDFFDTNDLKYESMSLGEKKINDYLINKNVQYIFQKSFPDCRDKGVLRFDFYLPYYNLMIEFDGEQHYEETNYFSTTLEEIQHRDNIKNQYCIKKRIPMLRMKYNTLVENTIERTISDKLNHYNNQQYSKYLEYYANY